MDIKENIALNIIKYRKELKITQAELAEKLNYSDKAVSKWERAESVPDVYVLHQISSIFGITIDTLISPPKEEKPSVLKQIGKIRFTKGVISTAIVWFIAIVGFFFLDAIIPVSFESWLLFIYAIAITFLILFIMTSVWGKTFWNMIFVSIFCWMLIVSIYLTLKIYLPSPPEKLWEVLLIGVPLQIVLVTIFYYTDIKSRLEKLKHHNK